MKKALRAVGFILVIVVLWRVVYFIYDLSSMEDYFSYEVKTSQTEINLNFHYSGRRDYWYPKMEGVIDETFSKEVSMNVKEDLAFEVGYRKWQFKRVNNTLTMIRAKPASNPISNLSDIPGLIKGTELSVVSLVGLINGVNRQLLLLGEIHIANKKESEVAEKIVAYFDNIGYEMVRVPHNYFGQFVKRFVKIVYVSESIGRDPVGLKRRLVYPSSINWARQSMPILRGEKGKKLIHLESSGRGSWPALACFSVGVGVKMIYLFSCVLLMLMCVGLIVKCHKLGMQRPILLPNMVKKFCCYNCILIVFLVNIALGEFCRLTPKITNSWMIDNRNINMVEKIVLTLKSDQKIHLFLVLTGSGHTPGIAKILCEKYGFTEQPLKSSVK